MTPTMLMLTAWLTLSSTSLGLLTWLSPPHLRRGITRDAAWLLTSLGAVAWLLTL